MSGKRCHKYGFLVSLLILALMGCITEDTYAPVVNGWQDPSAMKSRYRVQKGDTLYSIACAFEMDYRDLAKVNRLNPPYRLRPGETLSMLPPAVEMPQSPSIQEERNLPKPHQTQLVEKKPLILPELERRPVSIPMDKPNLVIQKDLTTTVKKHCPWPAEGRILHNFCLQSQGGNKGVDIAGHEGDAIKAVAAGQVVYCGSSLPGYGNLIILKHDESYLTLYGHNQKMLVKEGDFVKKGAQIAEMGQTNAGVPMLHFEVRKFGKPVNPLNFIQQV